MTHHLSVNVDVPDLTDTSDDTAVTIAAVSTATAHRDDDLTTRLAALSEAQFAGVTATVMRRRSLTESMQVALDAYWDTVEAHLPEHRAVRGLQARRRDSTDCDSSLDRTDATQATRAVADWLTLIADVHQVRWELPVGRLALLISATLDGLITDRLATGASSPARGVLEVLGYQVGRYGRRPSKNQQH